MSSPKRSSGKVEWTFDSEGNLVPILPALPANSAAATQMGTMLPEGYAIQDGRTTARYTDRGVSFTVGFILFFLGALSFVLPALVGTIVQWGPTGFFVGIIGSIILVAGVLFVISRTRVWKDAHTPRWLLALALLLGGVVSIGLALAAEASNTWPILTEYYNWPEALMSFTGAYPEEILKGLVTWMLLHIGRNYWFTIGHAWLAGSLVGLSFEVIENLFYGMTFAPYNPVNDAQGAGAMWALRIIVGPGMHALFAGLVGIGIGYVMFSARRSFLARLAQGVPWMFAGFLAHFLWNYSWPNEIQFAVLAVVYLCALFAVIIMVRRFSREITNRV